VKREQYLQHRLHTLGTLNEAVSAMRSLSAHHFRLCRQVLPAFRAYRKEIDFALAEAGISQEMELTAPPGLLLIVSDLGLCGDYNSRLVQTAIEEHQREGMGPLYCVGRRPRALLARSDISPKRLYKAPASVDGLPVLLLQLAEDMLDEFVGRTIGSLIAVSARFEGAGRFSPDVTCILPVRPSRSAEPRRPSKYQSSGRLAAVAVREYLYTTLYELLLDALASEHGMRLVSAESARQWLEETSDTIRRQLSASRREATTQEVLDIVAGSRLRERRCEVTELKSSMSRAGIPAGSDPTFA
jgi:F-type H+-transporting ATPase subunit gamma